MIVREMKLLADFDGYTLLVFEDGVPTVEMPVDHDLAQLLMAEAADRVVRETISRAR